MVLVTLFSLVAVVELKPEAGVDKKACLGRAHMTGY